MDDRYAEYSNCYSTVGPRWIPYERNNYIQDKQYHSPIPVISNVNTTNTILFFLYIIICTLCKHSKFVFD